MATALEAVLQLREVERQRQEANSNGIANAIQMFNVARQQAQELQLKKLTSAREDRKYESDLKQQVFDNALKSAQQKSMDEYLKLLGGQSGTPTFATTTPPEVNATPTLQDAIPAPKPTFIQTPYMSSKGLGVNNKVDPAYNKQLELRNNQIKELEDFASPLEKLATRLEELDKAIDATPEFKEGVGSKLIAKGTNFVADINNAKWFKDYDLAFNKSFLPAAQAENMSKVMSDLDLKTQIASLGDPTSPRSTKKEALRQIRDSLGKYSAAKVNAFGADKEVLSKIYPNATRVFGGGTTTDNKISEEDIQHTLKLHPEITREQLLKRLGQ